MSSEVEEFSRLLNLVESTTLVKLNSGYALLINDNAPIGEHDYTIVPILHEYPGLKILEIWVEVGATQYRFALISEVYEHVEAVGSWLANGEVLLMFKNGLVKVKIPRDSRPLTEFVKL